MLCSHLAQRLEEKSPQSSPAEIARLTTLLLGAVDSPEALAAFESFDLHWQDIQLRMQAANDQHEAMTAELEGLAKSDPKQFTPDQIWILIRAIKVQSQMLRMYIGEPMFEAR